MQTKEKVIPQNATQWENYIRDVAKPESKLDTPKGLQEKRLVELMETHNETLIIKVLSLLNYYTVEMYKKMRRIKLRWSGSIYEGYIVSQEPCNINGLRTSIRVTQPFEIEFFVYGRCEVGKNCYPIHVLEIREKEVVI